MFGCQKPIVWINP